MLRALAPALQRPSHLARVERSVTAAPKRSAVAIVLRTGPTGDEILYVKRAASAHDAWSGQVAFPGGRRQADDADDLAAAVRETREEVRCSCYPHAACAAFIPRSSNTWQVGLRLDSPAFELLGRLPERPVTARGALVPGMALTPYVWRQRAAETPRVSLEEAEVAGARWVHEGWLAPGHVRFSVERPYSPLPPLLARALPAPVLEAAGLAAVRFPAVDLHEADPASLAAGTSDAIFRLWGITLGISSDLVEVAGRPSLNRPPVQAGNFVAQALITARMRWRAGRWRTASSR